MNLSTFEKEYENNVAFKNDDDTVKVTLVYYTELTMLGKDKLKTSVDKLLFWDVEQLTYFNKLDWGSKI